MKKLFLMALMVAGASAFAADSYLYWMVSSAPAAFDYAKIAMKSADGQISYLGDFDYPDVVKYDSVGGTSTEAYWTQGIAEADTMKYFVELYNETSTDAIFATDEFGYSVIAEYFKSSQMDRVGDAWSLQASDFNQVPEPTSGLLLLLGLAGLALKRKRAV